MSRTSIQEIDKMGQRLAKKCINESRRRALVESDNWRDNHMGGTSDNNKAFEEWARKAVMMGYPPEYIQSIGELNSWVGGGAESNGLIDWSSGSPVIRPDAYAGFADGDNNWFKRNNADERNAWFNERANIIAQTEAMMNSGMPPMGGGMPSYGYPPASGGTPPYGYPPMAPPPPPPYGGGQGGNDDIFKYMMINDLMRAQDIARNEAAAHPNQASGAPSMNPMLPFLLMGGGQRRPSRPSFGGGMPPTSGRPSFGGGMPPTGGRPSFGGGYNRPNPALFGGGMSRGGGARMY